jgi:hypothetical protein
MVFWRRGSKGGRVVMEIESLDVSKYCDCILIRGVGRLVGCGYVGIGISVGMYRHLETGRNGRLACSTWLETETTAVCASSR